MGANRPGGAPCPHMSRKKRTAQPQDRLWKLAGAQHGVVSRKQMRALGMSDDLIDQAIGLGRLHRVFRGAYAVGHPHRSESSRLASSTARPSPSSATADATAN